MPIIQSTKPTTPPKDGPAPKRALSDIPLVEKIRYILSTIPLFGRMSSFKPEGWNPSRIEQRNMEALSQKKVWKIDALTACRAVAFLVAGGLLALAIVKGGAIGISLGLILMLAVYLLYRMMFLMNEMPEVDNSWVDTIRDNMKTEVKKTDPVGGAIGVQRLIDKNEYEKQKDKPAAEKPVKKTAKKAPAAQPAAPASIPSGVGATITRTKSMIESNILSQPAPSTKPANAPATVFGVTPASTFEVLNQFAQRAISVAILNLTNGTAAAKTSDQMTWHEKQLYESSDLHRTLTEVEKHGLYPIQPIIYTPNVIFNGTQTAPVISSPSNAQDPKEALKVALRAALHNGITDIIIPTVGYGANKDNPEAASQLYREVFNEAEFKDKFYEVAFVGSPQNGQAMESAFAAKFPRPQPPQ